MYKKEWKTLNSLERQSQLAAILLSLIFLLASLFIWMEWSTVYFIFIMIGPPPPLTRRKGRNCLVLSFLHFQHTTSVTFHIVVKVGGATWGESSLERDIKPFFSIRSQWFVPASIEIKDDFTVCFNNRRFKKNIWIFCNFNETLYSANIKPVFFA